MPTSLPIPNAKGLLSSSLNPIYTVPGGKTAKIKNIKFSPTDTVTNYELIYFISYNNKQYTAQIFDNILNGGDWVNDDSDYELAEGMAIMAKCSIDKLVSFVVSGEEITP